MLALTTCTIEASMNTFRETNPFLLGDCRQDREHSVPKDAYTPQVLLFEAPPVNSILRKALKMLKSFQDSFTTEPIKRPEQHHVELLLGSIGKKPLECIAITPAAAGTIDVLAANLPAFIPFPVGELAQFLQLVFAVLALVASGHTSIYRYVH